MTPAIGTISPPPQLPYADTHWSTGRDWNTSSGVSYLLGDGTLVSERFGFRFGSSPRNSVASVPFWAIVLTIALAAGLPWIQLRFSLRTLLIGMTLVAVILGLIFALSR